MRPCPRLFAVLLPVLGLLAAPAAAQPAEDPARLCLDPTSRLERQYDIAPGLLSAIAKAESGRTVPGTDTWGPWPWTINAEGTPHYFPTKAEAIGAVRDLLLEGVTNIDVGCMQISLHWHNAQFTTLDDIFDPLTNTTYAAEYLRDLHDQYGGWEAAAGHYHSADRARRSAYLRKVLRYWQRGTLADAAVVSTLDDGPLARATEAFAEGRLPDALVLYDEALEMRPDDRTALHGRAATLDRLGRTDDALEAWRRLLAVNPGHARALDRLAEHVRRLPPQAGLAEAQRLWRLAPRQPALLALLGESQARAGHMDEALSMHLAAHRLAPRAPLPALNAAVLLDRQGRSAEALRYYTRFLDLYRDAPVPLTVSLKAIRERVGFLRQQATG